MSANRSVWQDRIGVRGVIRDSEMPKVEESHALLEVHAWAINPADAMVQEMDLGFVTYPIILGSDVASVVESVGTAIGDKFKIGDRVFGLFHIGGFQEHAVVGYRAAALVPDSVAYTEAVVIPLCISTSATSLFDPLFLGLNPPKVDSASNGKSVLVWGASSAAGCNAIQTCKGAGYRVVATCSPHNFDFVKSLGADAVLDYKSPTAVDDIVAELDKDTCAGIYCAQGSIKDTCQVSHRSKQTIRVATSKPVMPGDAPEGVDARFTFVTGGIGDFMPTFPYTFGGYLPEAMAKGQYKPAPPPQVVPTKGLEGVQEGIDLVKKGVSAVKIVVEIVVESN